MNEKRLLDEVNFICKRLGKEPVSKADMSLYRPYVPKLGCSVISPEELAYEYDHSERNVPEDYRIRFCKGTAARPTAFRTPQDIVLEAGFPRIVAHTIADTDHLKPAPQPVLEWAHEFKGPESPSLHIIGGTGAGKTTSAAIAVGYVGMRMDRGEIEPGRIAFCTASDLCQVVNGSSKYWARGESTKYEVIEQLATAPLLILDDVGREERTYQNWGTLSSLIEWRYNNMLATVSTSQFSFDEWLKGYAGVKSCRGDKVTMHEVVAIASRINSCLTGWTGSRDMLRHHIVDMAGGDRRLEGR